MRKSEVSDPRPFIIGSLFLLELEEEEGVDGWIEIYTCGERGKVGSR